MTRHTREISLVIAILLLGGGAGVRRARLLHARQPARPADGEHAGADRGARHDAGDPHGPDRHFGGLAVRDLQRDCRESRRRRARAYCWPALAACLTGALLGALNGALVARCGFPSIVVTLATMVALRDGLRWITQGAWVQDLPPDFQGFGQSQSGQPGDHDRRRAVLLCAATAGGCAIWRRAAPCTPPGRTPKARGSPASSPSRVVFWVFTLTGALTGCAALFNSVRFNQIPSNAGIGMEMQVIAAVIVGGVAVDGRARHGRRARCSASSCWA